MKDRADSHLDDLVSKAIDTFNKYRSPEATAKLVETEKDSFILEFNGPFCQSCYVYDYFEDFTHELEDLSGSFRVEIKEIEPSGPQSFKVLYGFIDDFLIADVDEEALFREFLRAKDLSLREYLAASACTKDVIRFHFRTWLFERKTESKKQATIIKFIVFRSLILN